MNARKKAPLLVFFLAITLLLCACGQAEQPQQAETVTITDSDHNQIAVKKEPRVVSLYGSYTQAWLLAGGTLVGTTEDAVTERELELANSVQIVGTVKDPSLEVILSLEPDLVLLSADITAQVQLKASLAAAGVPAVCFQVDTFEDYDKMMQAFCSITGRKDLYQTNVTAVGDHIEQILAAVPDGQEQPNVLLIRAFSTGLKAKAADNLAGVMLEELGCHNIAEDNPAMLEDLSMEEVIRQDPDYIFVSTMGNEEQALAYMDQLIAENPAWSGLSAVQNGHYVILPKDLFHYKPNNRWDQSYEYLANILYQQQTV